MADPVHLLGFDIGGTKSAVALGDSHGAILDRFALPTADPDATLDALIDHAQQFCAKRGVAPDAAGVSVGSPLDRQRGLIQAPPNLPAWIDVPVRRRIRSAFDDLPVNLENDADAGALAEWIFAFERSIDDLIYLTCGTGQGAGLIIGGRLHRGCRNLAGEIGHVRLEPGGPVGCHKAGSVEGFTCGRALGELAKIKLAAEHPPTALDDQAAEKLDGKTVGEAALAGDAFALQIVREVGHHLGRACAILIDVLNPQRISLGSIAIYLGDLILEPCRAAAQAEALASSSEACTIDVAKLGHRVQDLAALAAAAEALRD